MYNLNSLEVALSSQQSKSAAALLGSTAVTAVHSPPSPAISFREETAAATEILPPLSIDSSQPPLNIVVIHGDPTKPNDILPGGKWDEDDYYTIQRAKEALAQLPQYRFKFLCSHDTLIDDLRRLKRDNQCDLVLQLCDEGWMNNSRMELHVTALLEMIDLPYTGVGPKTIGITYDKQGVLKIAESIGVPVPKSVYIEEGEDCDPIKLGLEFPVIVKPNSTDGSFGRLLSAVYFNFQLNYYSRYHFEKCM
jgi:D-alanine-D-alanine ligase